MTRRPSTSQNGADLIARHPWLVIAFFVVVLAVSAWQTRPQPAPPSAGDSRTAKETEKPAQTDQAPSNRPIDADVASEPNDTAPPAETSSESRQKPVKQDRSKSESDSGAGKPVAKSTRVENQTIRDQSGRVVFQGTIDLQPTLDRIARGDSNSHRNDGTTFQNRERRLPAKPSGYYKEYVHPTPKLGGPGPQRIIVGKDGDVWYTPDHYQTFRRIE